MSLAAVILAAGKGTRMKSRYPKVLHQIGGKPLLRYVVQAAQDSGASKAVVVVGAGQSLVEHAVFSLGAKKAVQVEQLGTAHALMQAEGELNNFQGDILVLCGDTPLLRSATLKDLVHKHRTTKAAATVLTAVLADSRGYGRIVRDSGGKFLRIVEQADASPEEENIQEINTGVFCFSSQGLFAALQKISAANRQGEYYLTDILAVFLSKGRQVATLQVDDVNEVYGINDRRQLAAAEKIMRLRILDAWMDAGVTIEDPQTTYISASAEIGQDTIIKPFSIIEGNTSIGEECLIGPDVKLVDAVLGEQVAVEKAVVLESRVGDGTKIGPFAYLRPGCDIGAGVKIGDFVEVKNAKVGDKSKIPHLSYVGDAVVGERVNIGAGAITCNFDGQKKWTTVIKEGAFIGSNANLIAPVTVGKNAFIGAGSTIKKDVPDNALGITGRMQKNIPDWRKRKS